MMTPASEVRAEPPAALRRQGARGWSCGALALLLAIAALAIAASTRRDVRLTARATRVRGYPADGRLYAWLGSDHVLFIAGSTEHERIARLDTSTGATVTVPVTWKDTPPRLRFAFTALDSLYPSPGGRWVLIPTLLHRTINVVDAQMGVASVAADGRWDFYNFPLGGPWLPRGAGWVALTSDPSGVVAMVYPAPPGRAKSRRVPTVVPVSMDGNQCRVLLGFNRRGEGLIVGWSPGTVVDLNAWWVDLQGRAAPGRFTLRIPPDSRVDDLELSPDGGRLAWLVYAERDMMGAPLIRRLWPGLKLRPRIAEEVWISRADGSDMRRLGAQRVAHNWQIAPDCPHHLRWTPDGKRVSFVYHDGLYTAPAD